MFLNFVRSFPADYDCKNLEIVYTEQMEKFLEKKEKTEQILTILNPNRPKELQASISSSSSTNFNTVEFLAHQLTWIDAHLFQSIQFREILEQSWSKKDAETKSPNVMATIRR